MTKILFVCHGNICRSPMAEFILKDMVKKQGVEDDFYIASAATSDDTIHNGHGSDVYPEAKKELTRHCIPFEIRESVQLRRDDYDKFDYLIGMDEMNIRNIERITGHSGSEKIRLLTEFTDTVAVIDDPWYTRDFDKAYSDIEKGCEAFLNRLLHLRDNA